MIYKKRPNDVELECEGIYVSENTFESNYGCYNTIGNVALICKSSPIHHAPVFGIFN